MGMDVAEDTAGGAVDILLVEDDPRDVELTLRAFRKHRLANHIHLARDGEEALEFLFREGAYADRDPGQQPRLVLLDLKLPRLNGREVLRRIKSDPRTRRIPVVVLTSSTEERDMIGSYDLGVNSYVAKPVNFESFIEAVRQMGMYWLLLNEQPGG